MRSRSWFRPDIVDRVASEFELVRHESPRAAVSAPRPVDVGRLRQQRRHDLRDLREYGGFLAAGDDSHNRNVMIDVRPDKGMSQVSITVPEKK